MMHVPNQVLEACATQAEVSPAAERHYTPEELANLWSLSADTVRRLFEREPGVLLIERPRLRGRRRYRTLRIPESVAARVHRRLTCA
jgi:hypothetical protein